MFLLILAAVILAVRLAMQTTNVSVSIDPSPATTSTDLGWAPFLMFMTALLAALGLAVVWAAKGLRNLWAWIMDKRHPKPDIWS